MATGAIISKLKKVIDALPDDWTMKSDSVENYLSKQGVKPEELKWAELQIEPGQKLTKADLQRLEQARTDKFTTQSDSQAFMEIGLPEAKLPESNYSMDIVGFQQNKADEAMSVFTQWENGELNNSQALARAKALGFDGTAEELNKLDDFALSLQGSEKQGRYVSSHVPEEQESDYLYHTRGFDRELDGQPTRVVQEIQSDLHQQGRQLGYAPDKEELKTYKKIGSKLKTLSYDIEKEGFDIAGLEPLELPEISDDGLSHMVKTQIDNFNRALENIKNPPAEAGELFAENMRQRLFNAANNAGSYLVGRSTNPHRSNLPPESPLEKNWLRKGIEREVVRAANEGKTQIAIPISGEGTKNLARSAGVTKWYGAKVAPTAKKIAKSLGGNYKATKEGDVEYAVIELPKDEAGKVKPFETELYSPAAAGLGATALTVNALTEQDPEKVQAMKDAGFNDEQIAAYAKQRQLVQMPDAFKQQAAEQGFTEEQLAQYATVRQQQQPQETMPTPSEDVRWESDVPQVTESGEVTFGLETLPEEDVKRIAKDIGVDPNTQEGINRVYNTVKREQVKGRGWADVVSDDIANFEEITNVDRPWQWFKSHFGAQANAEYEAMQQDTTNAIIQMGKERNLDLYQQEGEWLVKDPNDPSKSYPVTPGLLSSLSSSKYEIGGAIAGAAAGARMVQGLESAGLPGKIAKMLAIGGGSVIGAVIGDQGDYLEAAIEAEQKWSQEVAFEKALGTAQATVIYDTLGYGIFKAVGSFKSFRKAYNYVVDGNPEGAYRALKEAVGNISDDEVEEIVTRWEKLNQQSAPGKNIKEKAIAVIPATQAGGERIIAASAAIDPSASSSIANEVNQRAQSLLKVSGEKASDKTGQALLKDLGDYQRSVKMYFDQIKTQGENLAPDDYRFNLEGIAIRPLIEHKISTIQDPSVVDRFTRVLDKIDAVTDSRSFADLLELRREINDLKYGTKMDYNDKKAIGESLGTVDSEIKRLMGTLPDGKQWLDDWKDANKQYTQMKNLEKNAMFKAVTRPGLTEDDIAKRLIKYGPSVDTTYSEVMAKLSPAMRKGVEDSIVDTIVNKNTLGKEGEFRAIHFPELAKALQSYKFQSPDAERIKEVVNRMAEVYRNDPKLAAASGNINLPQFQSYLTTDPIVRAQYEAASGIFNYIKRLVPSKKMDSLALVNKAAKLLENPLNAKTTQQVIDSVKEDQQLVASIRRMQSEIAKGKSAGTYSGPRSKMYKDKSGKLWLRPDTGRTEVTENAIPTHRLVGAEEVKRRFKLKKLKASTLTKATRQRLLDDGFAAIVLNDGQIIKLY